MESKKVIYYSNFTLENGLFQKRRVKDEVKLKT